MLDVPFIRVLIHTPEYHGSQLWQIYCAKHISRPAEKMFGTFLYPQICFLFMADTAKKEIIAVPVSNMPFISECGRIKKQKQLMVSCAFALVAGHAQAHQAPTTS